jgi:5'/3'-nucleotidase
VIGIRTSQGKRVAGRAASLPCCDTRVTPIRVAVLLLAICTGCSAAKPAKPLVTSPTRILLTNDDGIDAPGITALWQALAAHPEEFRLTVVAPSGDRSGSSMSMTFGNPLRVIRFGEQVYAIDGTPADCTMAAIRSLMPVPPDIVVSGANFGQNLGGGTLLSGTVGAAMAAMQLGFPAVAVSVGVDPKNRSQTDATFPDAAAFTVRLLRLIRQHPALLPQGTVLNVNYPPLPRSQIAGLKVVRQGRALPVRLDYGVSENVDRTLTLTPRLTLAAAGEGNTDTAALAAHFIAVTPLNGEWTATAVMDQLAGGLSGLKP